MIEAYLSGKSIPEIALMFGVPRSTARYRLKKAGVIRSRADAIRLAAKQGKLGSGHRGTKRIFSDQHKENMSKAQMGKGVGVSHRANGYTIITVGKNKDRGEHSVIMEAHIGRRPTSNECVHHKDHDRSNNDIENLQLMTRADHAKLHALENHRKRNKKGQLL